MSLSLYAGIDIGKFSHVACLISPALLIKHQSRYEQCPTFPFDQSRSGFEKLLANLTDHAPAHCCHVLLEDTGHYGRALEQYLQEKGVQVYQVHVPREKKFSKQKSDKRDAQALAVMLYNQVERHVLIADKHQLVRRLIKPSDTARLLRGLVQHRHELVRETTRRKNKLTAICDELFPEMTQIYIDPNNMNALKMREAFPTPQAIAEAPIEALYAIRTHSRPGNAQLAHLQELARSTIGTKDESRRSALLIEQKQLIDELRLLDAHIDTLNVEIEKAVAGSREGQILTSFAIIGPIQAAMIMSAIGSIENFESAAKLRAYCGWSPHQSQTGISKDSMVLSSEGNRLLKHVFYLVALHAVRRPGPWQDLYNRLVPLKCQYDERVGRYRGKMKVIGRICGQIIKVVYVLLRRDYDLLASQAGGELPDPQLYDAEKHHIMK